MSPKVAAFQKGQLLKIFIALLLESYQNKTYGIYIDVQSCKCAHTKYVNFSETFVAANIYRFKRLSGKHSQNFTLPTSQLKEWWFCC